MAVDREFAYILFVCIQFCDFLASFRCPSTLFFSPWADFGLFFGSLWAALPPWDAMEVALVCLRTFSICLTKSNVQFPINGFPVQCLRRNRWPPGTQPRILAIPAKWRGSRQSRQSGATATAPNPTSLAPVARMVSVYTNSPKLFAFR